MDLKGLLGIALGVIILVCLLPVLNTVVTDQALTGSYATIAGILVLVVGLGGVYWLFTSMSGKGAF